jgi:hypothetical protein
VTFASILSMLHQKRGAKPGAFAPRVALVVTSD